VPPTPSTCLPVPPTPCATATSRAVNRCFIFHFPLCLWLALWILGLCQYGVMPQHGIWGVRECGKCSTAAVLRTDGCIIGLKCGDSKCG
jgi:hypothetical protein